MNVVNPVQVQKYLGGIDYPATKDELLDTAMKQGADENVMETLQMMDRDEFNSPKDVTEAIGDLK